MFNWSEEGVEICLENLVERGCSVLYLVWVWSVKHPHERIADGSWQEGNRGLGWPEYVLLSGLLTLGELISFASS
jgi:hypothetical protein